jgi:ABC-type polysaccharide/polyol phosphate export permease
MGNYLREVWKCRYFWMSLVKMDLRTRYRGSILGLGWSLLNPLLMTAILCTVFCTIFKCDLREYAPYVLSGLATWNFLTAVTMQGCMCFFLGESYIRQHPAPLAVYPLRTSLGAMIHFLLALLVVLALALSVYGALHVVPLLSLLPTLVLLFCFGWSLSVLAGLANVFFQDTRHLVEVAFQILFYATPIMYNVELLRENRLGWLLKCNPLVPVLQLVREPILDGRIPSLTTFAAGGLTVLFTCATAVFCLSRLERQLIFHL